MKTLSEEAEIRLLIKNGVEYFHRDMVKHLLGETTQLRTQVEALLIEVDRQKELLIRREIENQE